MDVDSFISCLFDNGYCIHQLHDMSKYTNSNYDLYLGKKRNIILIVDKRDPSIKHVFRDAKIAYQRLVQM